MNTQQPEALLLAGYWETRAKDLQTWVDQNDFVEFGYRPAGLRQEQADQRRTAAELRRLYNALTDALDTTEKLKAQAARFGAEKAIAVQEAIKSEREAWPQLDCVIAWLENGCDPKEAAKELRLYANKIIARGQQ